MWGSKSLCITLATILSLHVCSAQLSCRGLPDGTVLPDLSSETDFYMCINEQMMQHYCPTGHYFNVAEMRCVVDSICRNQKNGALFPMDDNCAGYIMCMNNAMLKGDCLEGFIFDEMEGTCVQGTCN